MKRRLLLISGWAIGLALLTLTPLSGPPAHAQALPCDRYVLRYDGYDTGNDCSDERYPCATVQRAIDQAVSGDVVCVAEHTLAPGPTTYIGPFWIDKSITLDGAYQAACIGPPLVQCDFTAVHCDPADVILDAQHQGRVITIVGHYAPTINCFTLTNGNAAGLGGDPGGRAEDGSLSLVENDAGGGIYGNGAAPLISNNIITGNYGCDLCPASYGRGGGIYLLNAPSTAVIRNNQILNNVADNSTWGQGGGIMLRDSYARVQDNLIDHNRAGLSAGNGGAIAIRGGGPTIAGNEITWNVAGQSVMGSGGGIYIWSDELVTIEGNTIQSNKALSGTGDPILRSYGGGIAYSGNASGLAIIRGNTIRYNAAAIDGVGWGGGMFLDSLLAPSEVSHNVLEGNVAGFNQDGDGGGIYVSESIVSITDNILDSNYGTPGGDIGYGGGLFVGASDVLIARNVFDYNIACTVMGTGWGGGLVISDSVAVVRENEFTRNRGNYSYDVGVGGGMLGYRSEVDLLHNTFMTNTASWGGYGFGGGIYVDSTSLLAEGNTIIGNRASDGAHGNGGGMRIVWDSDFSLINNIIARNDAPTLGSGIGIHGSSGQMIHNTIGDNTSGDGAGVRVQGVSTTIVHLTNNIVVNQTTGILNVDGVCDVDAQYTLFEGNVTNYTAVDSTHEIPGPAALLPDYHLSAGSNAIDNAVTVASITDDIDRDWRPLGAGYDVGADERGGMIYLPLLLRGS